jgi:hypothetical protein
LSRSSCCSVSAGRLASREWGPSPSRSLPRGQEAVGRADRLFDGVDLVQRGAVLAAGLHAAELGLVLLELLAVIGELAFGLAFLELGLGQALLQGRDGLDLLLELAVDLDELGRDRVALAFAFLDEPDPALEAVELSEQVAQPLSPEMEKGVPVAEHPRFRTNWW